MARQPSFVFGALRGLRRQPLSYALGRFALVRRVYGASRGLIQRLDRSAQPPRGRELFPNVDVKVAVTSLRERALYAPLIVPEDIVSEIRRFAADGDCQRQDRQPVFRAADVVGGRLPGGEITALAEVLAAEQNQAVRAVVDDPMVLEIVSKYLGYLPTAKKVRLLWSFVCDASEDVRLKEGQTVVYHFDVESYNFIYANYYLVDVDDRSGAHTMFSGSHVRKPLSWLLGSAKRSDEDLRAFYPADQEVTIVGPSGYGFIQDASCYHRALAPVDRPRLMLQVRYS